MVSLVFVCSKKTWFEAQTDCRNMNQSITLNENEPEQDYWTGRYKRTSHWIKIIGIFHVLSPKHTASECLLLGNDKSR